MAYQNTVQDADKLYSEDEIVYIAAYSTSMTSDSLASLTGASWTNLGSLAEFSRESKIETQQPPSQNVQHTQIISKMAETINLTIQELSPTNYNKLLGATAQSQIVAGSSTSASETYAAAAKSADQFIAFANQSWSTTSATIPIIPTGIVISGSSTYVLQQDYDIIQDSNKNYGIIFFSTGGFSSTQAITNAYSFVPKASNILWHGGADEITPVMLKVYTIQADNRTITTYYPRAEYVSGGSLNDKAGGSGEYKDIKFTLEAKEHQSFTYNGKKQFKIEVQTTV